MANQAPPQQPPMPSMMPMLIMMFLIMILYAFDGDDHKIGSILNYALAPLGFDGQYPAATLLLVGAIMASLSAILRSFFMDMVAQAKNQQMMSAFNKELRQARMENNSFKIKKLTEMQPMMMAKSMESSNKMMKAMPFTMIVIIPLFLWVRYFISVTLEATGNLWIYIPWAHIDLSSTIWFMPAWILVYTLVSIPFAQIVNRIIRTIQFKRQMAKSKEGAELL